MPGKHRAATAAILIALLMPSALVLGLEMGRNTGTWPSDWPKELEALRGQARTTEVATGIQENIYYIPFKDRETFERIWPVILKLKTPGAPLRLSNGHPAIRIYAPSGGYAVLPGVALNQTVTDADRDRLLKEGKMLAASPPWPTTLVGPRGELPEYVCGRMIDGKMQWVNAGQADGKSRGFMNRARVEVELVVDGTVIDLNRIPLPAETPVVDTRFSHVEAPLLELPRP